MARTLVSVGASTFDKEVVETLTGVWSEHTQCTLHTSLGVSQPRR